MFHYWLITIKPETYSKNIFIQFENKKQLVYNVPICMNVTYICNVTFRIFAAGIIFRFVCARFAGCTRNSEQTQHLSSQAFCSICSYSSPITVAVYIYKVYINCRPIYVHVQTSHKYVNGGWYLFQVSKMQKKEESPLPPVIFTNSYARPRRHIHIVPSTSSKKRIDDLFVLWSFSFVKYE